MQLAEKIFNIKKISYWPKVLGKLSDITNK